MIRSALDAPSIAEKINGKGEPNFFCDDDVMHFNDGGNDLLHDYINHVSDVLMALSLSNEENSFSEIPQHRNMLATQRQMYISDNNMYVVLESDDPGNSVCEIKYVERSESKLEDHVGMQ